MTDFFSKYGEILESQVIKDARTGQSKGCAFVKFASMTNAEEAIKSLTSKDNPIYLPGVSFYFTFAPDAPLFFEFSTQNPLAEEFIFPF